MGLRVWSRREFFSKKMNKKKPGSIVKVREHCTQGEMETSSEKKKETEGERNRGEERKKEKEKQSKKIEIPYFFYALRLIYSSRLSKKYVHNCGAIKKIHQNM